MLAGQDGVNSLFHEPLSSPGHRAHTGLEGCRDLAVIPGLASLRGVGLQQDARLQQLSRWVVTFFNQFVKPFALLIAEPHDVPLYSQLLSHESSPSVVTGPSIQTSPSESRTLGTRSAVSSGLRLSLSVFGAVGFRRAVLRGEVWMELQEVIRYLLRIRRGAENFPLVTAQFFNPVCKVARMVGDVARQTHFGADDRARNLGP